jgi:hypothetical protein
MIEASHMAASLTEKRAELAGELIACERRIVDLREAIEHLDGAITVFDPNALPGKERPKMRRLRLTPMPHVQAARSILDMLRVSRTPLTSSEIATHLMAKCGMTKPTPDQRKAMVTKVRNMLSRQDRKLVVGEPGKDAKLWRLA